MLFHSEKLSGKMILKVDVSLRGKKIKIPNRDW